LEIRWLNILESGWLPSRAERAGPRIVLEAPSAGYWAVLVQAQGG
jgi:hypothetical protein